MASIQKRFLIKSGYDGARTVVQILVCSHFELVSLLLAQLAARTVAQMATQMIIFNLSFCCTYHNIFFLTRLWMSTQ